MKYFLSTTCFVLLFILMGCDKSEMGDHCISYSKAPVTNVEGPVTGSVNQLIPLTISFTSSNGCGQFGNFEQMINGTTSNISVIAKYQGCVCTQMISTLQTTYLFKATQIGTYSVKFYQTDNATIDHTILIQ